MFSLQGLDVGPGAVHQDDEVVGIADDPPGRQSQLLAVDDADRWCSSPVWPPRRHHVLIEHAQRDVGQQRGQDPALRGAGVGLLSWPVSVMIPALRNAFTNARTRLSFTLARTRSNKAV